MNYSKTTLSVLCATLMLSIYASEGGNQRGLILQYRKSEFPIMTSTKPDVEYVFSDEALHAFKIQEDLRRKMEGDSYEGEDKKWYAVAKAKEYRIIQSDDQAVVALLRIEKTSDSWSLNRLEVKEHHVVCELNRVESIDSFFTLKIFTNDQLVFSSAMFADGTMLHHTGMVASNNEFSVFDVTRYLKIGTHEEEEWINKYRVDVSFRPLADFIVPTSRNDDE